MYILGNRGANSIYFKFTEHKFTNKIRSFLTYAQKFTQKFHKRKEKVSGVYIDYEFGYKTKEPQTYYTRIPYPPDLPHTNAEIIKFAISDMEEKHNVYVDKSDPDEKNIYYLRGIYINYIYT